MEELNAPAPRRPRNAAGPTLQPPELLHQTDQQRDASSEISSEEIARRAYARWENSDRSHGRDQEHWYAAEDEIRRRPDRRRGDGEDMAGADEDDIG